MYKKVFILFSCLSINAVAISQDPLAGQTEINKEIAGNFYKDLWFSNNTDKYIKYVADTYTVHDIGDRKGVTEPAVEQKNIADFFWANGDLKPKFDFQIAEGDLVATRWIASYEPKTLTGKIFIGSKPIPIINVLRFENGKIVEFWNHRHDIDTNQTMKYVLKGLLIGLLIALVPSIYAFRLRRKFRKMMQQ
ncbi:nuclear transport factor 2 family protein [Robiginitalea aurantiaca]|uniref:Ester cyclase n=1 Tax=Robiginitalea aurantiaca TaxID=3056915 RepID=A0ABT7WAP5_9FLAO|nr:ester cyclase [Robiginitalea aurantiaca]MDM9629988.1 ester cyclase [Robiginitalea aurantiaca]